MNQIFWFAALILVFPELSLEDSLEDSPKCTCENETNDPCSRLKEELDNANKVIASLVESNRKLRMELQVSRKVDSMEEKKVAGSVMNTKDEKKFFENDEENEKIRINGWDENVDETNEFIYGLPSSSLQQRKIVIELGANNGEWIRSFLASNTDYWPLIVEPQPMYRDVLREIAIEVRHCNAWFQTSHTITRLWCPLPQVPSSGETERN